MRKHREKATAPRRGIYRTFPSVPGGEVGSSLRKLLGLGARTGVVFVAQDGSLAASQDEQAAAGVQPRTGSGDGVTHTPSSRSPQPEFGCSF